MCVCVGGGGGTVCVDSVERLAYSARCIPFSWENPGGRKNITILPSTASLRILLAVEQEPTQLMNGAVNQPVWATHTSA